MTGYDFHPEVENDFAEIWDFIAADSPGAADKVIADILESIGALVPFPQQGYRRPDLTGRPLRFHERAQLPYRLCAGREAIGDCGRHSWQPKPARDGRHPKEAESNRPLCAYGMDEPQPVQ